ncbi:MAG: hypothetical protein ACI4OS_02635 [Akkermansia sp.]
MNRVETAVGMYRNPYNCAQTVCHAFGRGDLAESLKSCGKGGAPGGVCGSLYSAMQILPDQAEEIAAAFEARCGARICRFVSKGMRVPCPECVRASAELLAQRLA